MPKTKPTNEELGKLLDEWYAEADTAYGKSRMAQTMAGDPDEVSYKEVWIEGWIARFIEERNR